LFYPGRNTKTQLAKRQYAGKDSSGGTS